MQKVYAISDFTPSIIAPLPKKPTGPAKAPRIAGKKEPNKPKGTIKTDTQPTGKEFKQGGREKMRDPKGKSQTFYPSGNKKVKIALSPEQYDDSFESEKLKTALNTIVDKVKSKEKTVFLDLTGMSDDKIATFAKHKINVMESLNEQLEVFSYEYDFPIVTKRILSLTELLNYDTDKNW